MNDFVIGFREVLEAALVVGIILSSLLKIGRRDWFPTVYKAVGAAILVSIFVAFAVDLFLGGLPEKYEPLYEAIIMFVAALLLIWMIFWMMKQRQLIGRKIREQVDLHVQQERRAGIFLLAFLAVFREGVEMVLFLKAAALEAGSGNNFWTLGAGMFSAGILGYVLFAGLKKLNLKPFFTVSTLLLGYFVLSLLFHGTLELWEFFGFAG